MSVLTARPAALAPTHRHTRPRSRGIACTLTGPPAGPLA
ncbi:hypothetical protein PCE31106_02903 [Pandoraea cepalis]|uniref:Uncharacterized protein n=1 Tax=Pandoraea cepalis TaxID=2508294 RepID=A0A5E4VVP7_9BURK|nr:hypothetical protein PCE31106_02903 [Pandoraea cepalis]